MAGPSETPSGIPGFDFLQGMFQNASAGLPAMGAWIAPTLKPEELDKRIQELKTVQFWLEQNARLLTTTIQALEVQRMTLATLQTLNLPLVDLGEALRIKVPAQPAQQPVVAPTVPAARAAVADPAPAAPTPASAAAAPVVDPMQWWNALTRQFGEIAAQAVREVPATAAAAAAAVAPVMPGGKVAGPAKAKSGSKPAARAAAKAPARTPRRAL